MKNKVFLILKKELREMFRDKKSLSMMLIIPFMIPLLVIGFSILFESEVNKDVEEYNVIGFAYTPSETEKSILKNLKIEPVYGTEEEIKGKYEKGELDLYLTKENTKYTINGNSSDTTSYASSLVENYISTYKSYLQSEKLATSEIDANEFMNIITLDYNISEEDNFIVSYITVYSFMFIIMAITVSATYPATDATAGEKERGTLETLLTFPIKSKDIIIGKFLSVSVSSIITGILGLVLMQGALYYVDDAFDIYKGIDLMLSFKDIFIVILIIISYSMLISGLCIAIASKCKSFKEAQSALTPLTFISFFPSMIAFLTNIKTSLVLSLVPFLNYTLIFTDLANGKMEILNVVAMFASTFVIIAIILIIIIKQYKSEKVLFSK